MERDIMYIDVKTREGVVAIVIGTTHRIIIRVNESEYSIDLHEAARLMRWLEEYVKRD